MTWFQENNASIKSFHNQVDNFMFSYVEQIGSKIERIKDKNLKDDIETLLQQFIPGLEEIVKLKDLPKKMKMMA